jgi:hypothetical protein
MLLVLFYLEDLRRLILSSTKPMQSGDPFEVARGILVAEGVISVSGGLKARPNGF